MGNTGYNKKKNHTLMYYKRVNVNKIVLKNNNYFVYWVYKVALLI